MFKVLTAASLLFASFSIRFEAAHEQTWNDATTLSGDQQQWDNFFRNSIKAIGDSAAKQWSTNNGQTTIRYFDSTGSNGETAAWDVTGNSDANNKQVEKVVQVKTTPDPSNKNVSTVTKTTFERNNLLAVSKAAYAWSMCTHIV